MGWGIQVKGCAPMPTIAMPVDNLPKFHLCGKQRIASWVFAVLVAAIFLQTLFFKFTGAEESVWIFTQLGAEPWGRWASGIAELVASLMILVPATRFFGAALSAGVIGGAIMSHLAVLGIVVQDDGGLLFGLAVLVLVCSLGLLWLHRAEGQALLRRLLNR